MLEYIISACVGAVAGAGLLALLCKITRAVTGKQKIPVAAVFFMPLLPLAVLVPVALLFPQGIICAGALLAGVPAIGSVICFLRASKAAKRTADDTITVKDMNTNEDD